MIFDPTDIAGVFVLGLERHVDERGWLARTYCADEFAAHGIEFDVVQMSLSFNARGGTLRGLHFQAQPAAESKLVRCTRGRIFDVAVDVRRSSPTYCRWTSTELDAERGDAMFIPAGCAHGFLTLEDATEISYAMSAGYVPELARGARWDDPAFSVEWPGSPVIISDRDARYPNWVW